MAENDVTIKTFTLEECAKHNSEKDCWLIIHGKVYDVTEFLDEHPGGYDIVVSNTSKDATEDFEEIGHSKTAKEMLDKYLVGSFAGGDSGAIKKQRQPPIVQSGGQPSIFISFLKAVLPILILGMAIFFATKSS